MEECNWTWIDSDLDGYDITGQLGLR